MLVGYRPLEGILHEGTTIRLGGKAMARSETVEATHTTGGAAHHLAAAVSHFITAATSRAPHCWPYYC